MSLELEKADPLLVAMRSHLQSILDGELNSKTLRKLEKTAKLVRELLAVRRDARAAPRANNGLYSTMVQPDAEYDDEATEGSSLMATLPIMPSSPAETFGSSFMRELVAGITELSKPKERPPSPPRLYELMETLKEVHEVSGMEDVAENIKGKIRALLKEEAAGAPSVVESVPVAGDDPYADPPSTGLRLATEVPEPSVLPSCLHAAARRVDLGPDAGRDWCERCNRFLDTLGEAHTIKPDVSTDGVSPSAGDPIGSPFD